MLDKIKNLFREGLEYTHTAGILQQLANLNNIVNAQYMKDPSGKNAAIDIICEILQSHKDVPVVEHVAPSPDAPKAA
jgi:hypothetical protein